ncbi:MAG: HD domain-containing protein [Candidatus Gribaldobacteria bacterium]|nr:HD domain-containing protein [Candidatus Gribaldobacteria bacterium]
MSKDNLEKIFDFLHLVESLKSTLRYNFTKSGRKESSADHSWRLSLMLFVLIKELNIEVDTEKSIKMALVHDLAEAITGDIDAVSMAEGKASKQDKQRLELEAMAKIKATLPQEIGQEIYSLWKEYDDASTKEAKCVKAVDKLETLTQLVEAGYKTYDKPQFIANYADKAVENFPELKEALAIIKRKLKEEFAKGNIPWEEKYDN